jgi:hypothetical protein
LPVQLKQCAEEIFSIDLKMRDLYNKINRRPPVQAALCQEIK